MKRTANRRKLKNYLITNKTHLRMMITNLFYTAQIFVVVICGVLFPFYHDIFVTNDIYSQHYLAKYFIVLLDRLFCVFIALFLMALIYQVLINHKFCGPLVNFSNTFKKISQGDLTRKIFLRRYDFLKDEAVQVNNMIDFLSNHIAILKKDYNRLIAVLEKVSENEIDRTEYQHALSILRKQVVICHNHLATFKIEGMDNRENEHLADM